MGNEAQEAGGSEALWEVIDRTRPPLIDPAAHAEAMTVALVAAGKPTTVEVGRQFDATMVRLNRWDLWGAAYLLLGGCGDDSFEYLRAWIIGRGAEHVERAVADADGYVAHLLAGVEGDHEGIAQRTDDLAVLDGEPLLYAVGKAHEQLTGTWGPAQEPRSHEPQGEPWDEDELLAQFPRLAAALPDGWTDEENADPASGDDSVFTVIGADPAIDTARRVAAGMAAFASGDNAAAAAQLGPVVDNADRFSSVGGLGFDPVDVAYVCGICRFEQGDPDGGAAALRLVAGGSDVDERVRRALAQIEMARGDLPAAEAMINASPDAPLMDRALTATLRWHQGCREEAHEQATALISAKPRRQRRRQHPWDVAGALVQAGFVTAELGDVESTRHAVDRISKLTRGAPVDLPLRWQMGILVASVYRQERSFDLATEALGWTWDHLPAQSCARGLAEREAARLAVAQGDAALAATRYGQAIATFTAAGERWHADDAAREASAAGIAL